MITYNVINKKIRLEKYINITDHLMSISIIKANLQELEEFVEINSNKNNRNCKFYNSKNSLLLTEI